MPAIVKVKVAAHGRGLGLPAYLTSGSAGADLRAAIDEGEELVIAPGETVLVPTGLFPEIPEGYEMQIRSRSSLALKHSITLPNSPGTIDSDFRGELKVIMHNLGKQPFSVRRGDRIAQAVVARFEQAVFVETQELSDSKRAEGGFGSTGRN